MMIVYKYQLTTNRETQLDLPKGAQVLKVDVQNSEIPSPCMTAQQFEKKATTIGLKKGFLQDFQFVESMDARICCLYVFGQQMTGFDSGTEHLMFGHWRNPEYQSLCQDDNAPICMICKDSGFSNYGFGESVCVDCHQGISSDFAKKAVEEHKTFESFVETYGRFCNGYPEYISKYWNRCKEIVENIDFLPY